MEKINLFIKDNYIFMNNEVIFDYMDYLKVYENIGSKEDCIFNRLFLKFNIEDKNIVYNYFTDFYNLIIINNIANYVIDKSKGNLYIDRDLCKEDININMKSLLTIENILSSVLICISSTEYYEKVEYENSIKLIKTQKNELEFNHIEDDKTNLNKNYINKENLKDKLLENKEYIKFFIEYEQEGVKEIPNRLRKDLIDFDFIKDTKKNNRYILPIYIDKNKLIEKGFENYEQYLPEWTSFAYINMIEKIHNYFKVIYGLNLPKNLSNDILSLALINLLDYEIKPLPKGVKKSIEKGRESTGKCFFIDDEIMPVSINEEILISLKSKDIFDNTPRILKIISN